MVWLGVLPLVLVLGMVPWVLLFFANTGVDEVFKLTGSDMDGGAGAVGAPVDVDVGYEDGVVEGSEEPVDLVSPDAEEGFG